MKITLKNIAVGALILAINATSGCKKESSTTPTNTTTQPNTDNYASVKDFFAKNAVPMQTYTITGSTGGSFTTPQGTQVTIPANCFINNLSQTVTGTVTIQFKDIYSRSDMLLSNMPTQTFGGQPLKSAGEFFIKALSGGAPVTITGHLPITVKQPFNGWQQDTFMTPFVRSGNDTMGWLNDSACVTCVLNAYVHSIFQLRSPVDSGTWFNTDDPTYFNAYPHTSLILKGTDSASQYGTAVFLVFHALNTMVLVHWGGYSSFPYMSAPNGLQCTVVAIGIYQGKVYSSFVPITIGANTVVNFTLSPTSTANFKSNLSAIL